MQIIEEKSSEVENKSQSIENVFDPEELVFVIDLPSHRHKKIERRHENRMTFMD